MRLVIKNIKVLYNISSLISLKAIDLLLNLWLIPYLILKVGLHHYGVYAFAMALILFFVNVLNYGFNLSTVREIAKSKNDKLLLEKIFNQVISVKIFLSIIIYVIIFLLINLIPAFRQEKSLYMMASLLIIGDLFSLRWFFMGLERMKFLAFVHLGITVIYVSLVFVLIQNSEDYIKIPLFEAIGMFVSSIIPFIWVLKKYNINFKLISITEIIKYLKYNFSSFVNLLLPSTYGTTIVFLVGILGLPIHVSFMQIGVKFTAAFTTLNTILTNVFYPMVNRNKSRENIVRQILILMGLFFSITMFLSCSWLIENWLNLNDQASIENTILVVKIMSLIPFLMSVISAYGINGLLTTYQDKVFGVITVLTTVIMIVSAFGLIPVLPIVGGALAFVIGRLFYAMFSFLQFKKIKIV